MSKKPIRMFLLPLAGATCALSFIAACQSIATGERGSQDLASLNLPGEDIAGRLCASCHAIDRTSSSPHPDALPFRQISLRYPVRSLEESLGEGIVVGHADMPSFQLEPPEIDALLSYIDAIQDPV
jgi:mono/diheme cytochrome c family protein